MIGADADLDRLAEGLREDGVVVDRVMGTGEAQQANDRLAALIREVPFPVYVALVDDPPGLPEDTQAATDALAGLLSRRLGDGLYVIQRAESGGQQVFSYGLDSDPSRLSLSAYANAEVLGAAVESLAGEYVATPPAVQAEAQVLTAESLLALGRGPYLDNADYPASLSDADTARLAADAVRLQASADWRPGGGDYVPVRTASSGLSAIAGVLSALVVALLLGQTLRGWPRRGKPLPRGGQVEEVAAAPPPPDLETERTRARELVDALTTKLETTDWDTLRDRDVAGRALTARDAVEPLLESDDVADLIGAQVIARAGSRDLVRARRATGAPLATCFFDPRHPVAKDTAAWRLGDGEVEVPCCSSCATTVGRGGVPDHLRLRARRGTVPYWERNDVWARTGFGAVTDDLARDVLADRVGER